MPVSTDNTINPTILNANDLLQLMQTRRSIRRFSDQPVSREVITQLLEAAHWGPSAHNRQPWRFVVLTANADKHALADAMAARLEADLRADGVSEEEVAKDTNRSRARITGASVVIVVCLTMSDMDTYPDPQRQAFEHQMAVQSVGMASQNLLLAAHAAGLGACWMCAPLFAADVVRDVLSLPDDFEPQGMIVLGKPAEVRQRGRESLESRVIWK